MCNVLLPPGVNPIAVNKYIIISYHISYRTVSYHISYHIVSYLIVSFRIISYHIVSCRVVSYRFISYHIISYHVLTNNLVFLHEDSSSRFLWNLGEYMPNYMASHPRIQFFFSILLSSISYTGVMEVSPIYVPPYLLQYNALRLPS